jgi:hypothetical protein
MKIQLLAFHGCPNAEAAREALQDVLASSGIAAEIEEVSTDCSETPEALRGWGSPTVLINGVDIEGEEPSGSSCRLYRDERGQLRGVPSVVAMRRALSTG